MRVKDDKIEQLCEELLQKDHTIAQQAQLHKSIQKLLDQEKSDHLQSKAQQQQLQDKLREAEREKKLVSTQLSDANGEIAKLKSQHQRE